MPIKKIYLLFLLHTLAFPKNSITQEIRLIEKFDPQKYVCFKTETPINIDGKSNEESWKAAPWTNYFIDITGDSKSKPYLNTKVKMLWDNTYLYFLAEMEEPNIWATIQQHDSIIFRDNDFEIFIDPDGDTHNYYEFEINAFNTVWDLLLLCPYRDQSNPVVSAWDINGLKSSVYINGTINNPNDKDSSWTVEIAMPWNVLKERANGKPKEGSQWRINFSRVEWKTETKNGKSYSKKKDLSSGNNLPENDWTWSPQSVVNIHLPEMWGFVQFSEQSVFDGKQNFIWNEDEDIKWLLRKMYYIMNEYYKQHHCYTADLTIFKSLENEIKKSNLKIEFTTSMYEISETDNKKEIVWHIRQDGKTWKTGK